MMYLLFSILASTFIFVIFKLFNRFKVNTLHAIVINYVVACISGIIAFKGTISLSSIPNRPWFYYTLGLGVLFIIVFNLMARTTQRSGLAVVSVATKMSVVIPIVFGLLYFNESLDIYKGIGIITALIAVYLASIKKESGITIQASNLILPLLVFLGSGIIDTSLKYLENAFVPAQEVPLFSSVIFSAAAVIGFILIGIQLAKGSFKFEIKNVIAGICLGVPNYFSIYFLVKALQSDLMDSSGIFTVNNVAIVLLSTIVGILLFNEKLLLKNWLGIFLAIISIFLVTVSSLI
ncbi:DMT family transporter [Patiriisocius marinus]|uniref:DMT family transporter n=1 Tax=Patiriisocius marinus TaxID=1397112 RepID=UPI00232CD3C7|nr:DMT family transporter [Patiriisocius marinus]